MFENGRNEYAPDFVSPPGETLRDILEDRGMTQVSLAERTGRPKKTISEIVNGKAAITPETAQQFALALGVPAAFWNNREKMYQAYLAQKAQLKKFERDKEWVKEFPYAKMAALGWVTKCSRAAEKVQVLLSFFGVASAEQWREVYGKRLAQFRQSPKGENNIGPVSAWLRKGELEAQATQCASFSKADFQEALKRIRPLTRTAPSEFLPKLKRLCADAGVAVALVPALPKTGISGATRWLTKEKALIQLSLRYKTDDQLWFTFFHEAGHVLLHAKTMFLENGRAGGTGSEQQEAEADAFAADQLIPADNWKAYTAAGDFRLSAADKFAEEVGISPGVVVGRMQHEKLITFKVGNGLKRRFEWVKK